MMEDYEGMNLKRKELEEIDDDFSDFSLCSPAVKIRRLDVELLPIIEEKDAEVPLGYGESALENVASNLNSDPWKQMDAEELPVVPQNEEKTIVLFKPMNNSLSYSVDPNLVASFKNQAIWGFHLNAPKSIEVDECARNGDTAKDNTCREVIPWDPSKQLNQSPISLISRMEEVSEVMDADEVGASTMDIDDAGASNVGHQSTDYVNHSRTNEGLQHQWQQQHCMIPHPQNTFTPVMWYR